MLTVEQRLAACVTYGKGTKAYVDSFGGMVPCTVLEVLKTGTGFMRTRDAVLIRIDETLAGYTKGEIIKHNSCDVVPRKHRVIRGMHYRINTNYRWE